MPVNFATFNKLRDATLKSNMKTSVEMAAKGGADDEHLYVAAAHYHPPQQTAESFVFVIVDKFSEYENYFKSADGKKQSPKLLYAVGVAGVSKDNAGNYKILVKDAKGSLPKANIVNEVAKKALANIAKLEVTTPEAEKAAKVARIVGDSYAKAGMEFKPDARTVEAMAQTIQQVPEFKTFSDNYKKFMTEVNFGNTPAITQLPAKLWHDLFQGLITSGYWKKAIPRAADETSFILAYKGPEGKPIREKMLQDAMDGLQPFVDHASKYLDKIAQHANQGDIWAFWSGKCALDAAKASGGVSLEGTVGSLFDGFGWATWPPLIGSHQSELPLWTSVSEMYAKKAAEYVSKFVYHGYLGPTGSRDQSVFNKIEQPTFIQVLTARQQAHAHIDWYVVDCQFDRADAGRDTYQGNKGTWTATGRPAQHFDNRPAAIARIIERYEF